MRDLKSGIRYAKSLFELAEQLGETERLQKDMVLLNTTISNSKDLQLLLNSPIIKPDKKSGIMKAIFGTSLSPTTLRFIELLIDKHREMHILSIAKSFEKLYKESKKIAEATLVSAVPLSESVKNEIKKIAESQTGYQVELIEKIDPAIIGGFKLSFNNQMIDASIETEIQKLKNEYSQNPYEKAY
jgi:F-type H+-transporting ATPase subunit delta